MGAHCWSASGFVEIRPMLLIKFLTFMSFRCPRAISVMLVNDISERCDNWSLINYKSLWDYLPKEHHHVKPILMGIKMEGGHEFL